jgi:uncharacterized repeat protein (TIGR01451 family)
MSPSSSSASRVDCSTRAAITHVQVSVSGGTAQATFGVAPGCTGIRVSLATYRASSANGGFPQVFNDSATGVFSAGGPFTLSASVSPCFYQVDLVLGNVITHLVSTGNQAADIANGTLYGNRKLKVVTGGSQSCGSPPPPPPPVDKQPISVFVECVTNHASTFDATFGYSNDNNQTVTIPAGSSDNAFSPAPADRGQVSDFLTGSHANVFTVSGTGNAATLVWSVTFAGQTRLATATSAFANKCGSGPPPTTTGGGTTTSGGTTTTTSGVTTTTLVPTNSGTVDVAVTKTVARPTVAVGSNATFTARVSNNGTSTATNVSFIDTLPAGLTLVSAASTQGSCGSSAPLTCNLGTIAAGATATITIVARATEPGTLVNRATVTSSEADTNLANNSAQATVKAAGAFKPPKVKAKKAKAKVVKAKPKHVLTSAARAVAKSGKRPSFTG